MAITYPPVFINEYLAEKVTELIPDRFYGPFRFFPTLPTDLTAMTESFPEASNDVFAVFDRMFRMRRTAFPHIKEEQVIYTFYKMNSDIEALMETVQIVSELLDRTDESAQEINAWLESKIVNGVVTFGSGSLAREFNPVFFHELKIYQLEETSDLMPFETVRTHSASKIVISYKYHAEQRSFHEEINS
jgi:Trp operon repressor